MKRFTTLLLWILVAATTYGFFVYYQSCFPGNPPGWEFHHNRTKSGCSPEDVMRMYHFDPVTQEDVE